MVLERNGVIHSSLVCLNVPSWLSVSDARPVTLGVYEAVDVSMEIDGLSNMQDSAGVRTQYTVSSEQLIWG